jgi:hypothetical protein
MSSQTCPPRRNGLPGRGIALGAAIIGLLTLATGCGISASPVVINARPAAAHEAIQPAAGEGSLGWLRRGSGKRKPGEPGSGNNFPVYGNALFGGNDGLVREEGALGRKLAIVRVYYHIGETFPVISDREHMAAGSTLLVSLDSTGTSYASIAAGHKDATIMAFLGAVNRAAIRYHLGAIYISFEHEPDGPQHAGLGSPAEFVRAWDHVHQLAESAHLNWNDGGRLRWVLILIHNTYAHGGASPYWPGAGEVNIVAADGYNSYRCGHWQHGEQTPANLFNPLLGFAADHGGIPVFISEWGSDSATPSTQPRFIQEMQAYVTSNRDIAAALYWDDGGGGCNYRVDGHPASLAAMAALGRAASMQGSA